MLTIRLACMHEEPSPKSQSLFSVCEYEFSVYEKADRKVCLQFLIFEKYLCNQNDVRDLERM